MKGYSRPITLATPVSPSTTLPVSEWVFSPKRCVSTLKIYPSQLCRPYKPLNQTLSLSALTPATAHAAGYLVPGHSPALGLHLEAGVVCAGDLRLTPFLALAPPQADLEALPGDAAEATPGQYHQPLLHNAGLGVHLRTPALHLHLHHHIPAPILALDALTRAHLLAPLLLHGIAGAQEASHALSHDPLHPIPVEPLRRGGAAFRVHPHLPDVAQLEAVATLSLGHHLRDAVEQVKEPGLFRGHDQGHG